MTTVLNYFFYSFFALKLKHLIRLTRTTHLTRLNRLTQFSRITRLSQITRLSRITRLTRLSRLRRLNGLPGGRWRALEGARTHARTHTLGTLALELCWRCSVPGLFVVVERVPWLIRWMTFLPWHGRVNFIGRGPQPCQFFHGRRC